MLTIDNSWGCVESIGNVDLVLLDVHGRDVKEPNHLNDNTEVTSEALWAELDSYEGALV